MKWIPKADVLAIHLHKLYYIISPYFRAKKKEAWFYFACLLFLGSANSGISVYVSFAQRNLTDTVTNRNETGFGVAVNDFLYILLVAVPIFGLNDYIVSRSHNKWRRWLSTHLIEKYLSNRNYYKLYLKSQDTNSTQSVDTENAEKNSEKVGENSGTKEKKESISEGELDNPDQRICVDVMTFTHTAVYLVTLFYTSTLKMISFVAILWVIEPYLVVFLFIYTACGSSFVGHFFGSKMIPVQDQVRRKEADTRFSMVRVRENAEAIAFYSGEGLETKEILRRFGIAMSLQETHKTSKSFLGIFQNSYSYLTWLIPVMVLYPRFFKGEVEYGTIFQAQIAFNTILGSLSLVISRFDDISFLISSSNRLYQFKSELEKVEQEYSDGSPKFEGETEEKMEEKEEKDDQKEDEKLEKLDENGLRNRKGRKEEKVKPFTENKSISRIRFESCQENMRVCFKGVDIYSPSTTNKACILSGINFVVEEGQSVIIVGRSGIGKSSILRVLCSLWTHGKGIVERPDLSKMLFLPQKPYMPIGTLRQQLMYPKEAEKEGEEKSITDEYLVEILEKVQLGHLIERHGIHKENLDYSKILSVGEQQRLAIARVLVNKPWIVVMDEATSAMDLTNESLMYRLISDLSLEDDKKVTILSVGHRKTLLQFHSHVLNLDEISQDGGYSGIIPMKHFLKERDSLE